MSVLQSSQVNEFQMDKEIEREMDIVADAEHDGFKFYKIRLKKRYPMGVPYRIGFVNALNISRHSIGMTGGEEELVYKLVQKNVFFRYDRNSRAHIALVLDDSEQPDAEKTGVVIKEIGLNMRLIARHIMDGTFHELDDPSGNKKIQAIIKTLKEEDESAVKVGQKVADNPLSENDVREMTNRDIDAEIQRLIKLKNMNMSSAPGYSQEAEEVEKVEEVQKPAAKNAKLAKEDNPRQVNAAKPPRGVIQM